MAIDKNKDFIREWIVADMEQKGYTHPITRFPPEPNGYLHIGHAKAICLDFGVAKESAEQGGVCHLRFDDTNPCKEDVEFVNSIQEDIHWLGFDWGEHLYWASNIFDFYYDCAVDLIKRGLAYVDEQDRETMRIQRGDLTHPGTPSPFRDRPVEENLAQFEAMKAGKFPEGGAVLRAKIDMASSNMNMRDPVIYRISYDRHHNTGDKWCIYPMYDFAHPLEDAYEHITHSLCTLEFENHRPLYDWVIDNCDVPARPQQREFSRLNITYTVMSKRKLRQMVEEGTVAGWDDPRMPTICGMRRRGYPAKAIVAFCEGVGITKFNGNTDVARLENEVRSELNHSAERRMAVLHPLKLVLTNVPEGWEEEVEVVINPEQPELGNRKLTLTKEVWIDEEDFMVEPPKKYKRLSPGACVRLRGGYCMICTGYTADENGKVTEVQAEIIPGTVGSNPPEGIKCKGAIHWVSVPHGVKAEIRLYDRLFKDEAPDANPEGFMASLNTDSLTVLTDAVVEPALAAAPNEFLCQFERTGYFVADRYDHSPEHPVFNRSVGLRDSWAKMNK
ncbi:MAG: glutamine--tRNA ligase/YqeY domain fusion protein [Akkermansia sp.]|nr:glutamine--tRNA ligase/YqeY domain fusion protein [Akkermansia sp.]